MTELVQQATVVQLAQSLRGYRRSPGVPTQSFQTLPVVGRDGNSSVKTESVDSGKTRRLGRRDIHVRRRLHLIPEAQHTLASALARGDSPLNRGGEQLRQKRIVLGQAVGLLPESTPLDDAGYSANDAVQNPLQLRGFRRRGGRKSQRAVLLRLSVDAIENQRVKVDIEVESAAESLDEGHRTTVGRAR